MTNPWKLVLVFIYPSLVVSTPFCNPKDNCQCYPDKEIHCPSHSSGGENVVIHLGLETTKIDCYKMKNFRMDLLPNVTAEINIRLEINNCPLPVDNFKKIVEHFSMNGVKVIQFENWNESVILTKTYFDDLDLDRVKLNLLNFSYIDEEVFSSFSNLYFLEMERNTNLTLTPKIFQNLTKLNLLFLAQNSLEDLPDGLFSGLGSLRKLHLWNNNLTEIGQDTFSGLGSLTSLDVHANKIGNLSEKSFQHLKKIESVNLAENRLGIVSAGIFRNNENISKVLLDHNPGLQIPDYFFANFQNLHTVQLSHCNLSSIPEHSFENSTNLTVIVLQKNKLTKIPSNLFSGLVNLKKLYLQNNLISEIRNDIFEDLSSLEEIDLSKNLISKIQYGTFYGKRNLKIINLSHNILHSGGDGSSILKDAPKVTKLDLSHNLLTKVEQVVSPHSLLQLKELDLRHNQITALWLIDLQSIVDMKVYLDYNYITRINFENIEGLLGNGKITISLTGNPLECNCDTYELTQFLRGEKYQEKLEMFDIVAETLVCDSPQKLQGQRLTDLSQSALGCDLNGCPLVCSCSWRPFDTSVIIDCQNKNLTEFPFIGHSLKNAFPFNQTELHLEGNYLESGPNVNFEGYNYVTKLYLSYNRIRRIDSLPPKLKVLHLDNNQLSFLDFSIIDILNTSNLVNLTLHNNDWICDCNSVNLTNFLRQHSKLVNVNNIKCRKSPKLLINLTETDLCSYNTVFYIVIPLLVIMLFFMTLVVLFCRYQQEIKVWLFAHNLLLWWVTEEELDKDKRYDAFISYSHKDESFVMKELAPVLQNGPTPYKLCLHERDWIPGEFISTQIVTSVQESRRTLIVLSPSFLESTWGTMEFKTAHAHAMTEGRSRVIIVVHGDIDTNKLSDELKSYMKTNTYVKWEDPRFWNKLRYALPHPKMKVSKQNQKSANVRNCVDDKLTLVVHKSSSNTTPPILCLEANDSKKHPLDFVPKVENTSHVVEIISKQ